MLYVYIGVGIVVLFLVGNIIRWWNLPAVAEARRKQTEARAKQREAQAKERTERAKIRAERRRGRGTIEQPATMPAPEKRRRPRRREAK